MGHSKAIEVGNNHSEVIGGNFTLSVGPSAIGRLVSKDNSWDPRGIPLKGYDFGILGGGMVGSGNMFSAIERSKMETIGLTSVEIVGSGKTISAGGDYKVISGGNIDISSSGNYVEDSSGKRIIESGQKLEFICGNSRMSMHPDGKIIISGSDITLSSTGGVFFHSKQFIQKIAGLFKVSSKKIELN